MPPAILAARSENTIRMGCGGGIDHEGSMPVELDLLAAETIAHRLRGKL